MSVTVSLHLGDCVEWLATLPAASVDAVVMDPPYGEGMPIEGDETITGAVDLLDRALGGICPALRRGGHVAIFWTMRSLDACIDAVRARGLTYRRTIPMYIPKGGARPYLAWLPRVQPIVLAQKYLPKTPYELHAQMAAYLSERIEASGMSRAEIGRRLGCDSRLVMKWSRPGDPAWCLPTPRFYGPLKELLGLDDRLDSLAERPRAVPEGRPDLQYQHDIYIVERPASGGTGHPCEKPLDVVRHLVDTLAAPGEVVADPFMGRGTTGRACVESGRRFLGCEIDPEHFAAAERSIGRIQRPAAPARPPSDPPAQREMFA